MEVESSRENLEEGNQVAPTISQRKPVAVRIHVVLWQRSEQETSGEKTL